MQRILVITLSNIGDCVMTTPVLEALHKDFPGAVFDVVADARSSELFSACPFIGEIIEKRKRGTLSGRIAFLRRLRRVRYDLIVDLRTDGLSCLLRARRRLTRRKRHLPETHAVERHFAAIRPLVGDIAPPWPRLWIDAASRDFAAEALAPLHPAQRILALAPGANWEPKIWPAERFIELTSALPRGEFEAVLLVGGPGDRERSARIARVLDGPVADLTGRTGLLQAAAALERAAIFVGNDSGLGHIAAAVGVPTVTVFGPGEPLRYSPRGPWSRYVLAPAGDLSLLEAEKVAKAMIQLLNEVRGDEANPRSQTSEFRFQM